MGGRLTCWVLLLVIPGLGMAQEPTGLPPAGYRGWTFCRPSGEVESWYRDDAVTAQLLPRVSTLRGEVEAIRAHERVHWEQYHRYATCGDADQARVGSADTALAFEAEAYCAQLRVLVGHGADPRDLVGPLIQRLLVAVDSATVPRSRRALRRWCRDLVP